MRMTIGTGTPRSLTAAITPSARMSQRRMPPKMLISTALTFLSDIRMRKAFLICSALAPPPTSRKFAGSPPASLMMSIVAIASPAPLTMQPIVAIELDVVQRELGRLDFERLFLRHVPQFLDVRMAVERVVVEGHLRVEREEVAVFGHDERD